MQSNFWLVDFCIALFYVLSGETLKNMQFLFGPVKKNILAESKKNALVWNFTTDRFRVLVVFKSLQLLPYGNGVTCAYITVSMSRWDLP